MITLLSLNIWGYNDWSNRKDNIFKVINESNPDVIGLQEVCIDNNFSASSQAALIAQACGYEYCIFVPALKKNSKSTDNAEAGANQGIELISKYPILSSEAVILERNNIDREPTVVLFVKIRFEQKDVSICNVHFENNDDSAELHLKETINIIHAKNITPIIIGDFNIYNLNKYKDILNGYSLSSDVSKYVSFPRDNGTLDYVVIPDSQFSFQSIECPDVYVSDHKAVLAKLNMSDPSNE